MKLTPRAKMLLVIVVLPRAHRGVGDRVRVHAPRAHGQLWRADPAARGGHGARAPAREDGTLFGFAQLRDRWVLLASDSPECGEACAAKLHSMRQVRLALGRDALRVARVLVLDGPGELRGNGLDPREDLQVVRPAASLVLPPGPARDPAHIYLVDPRGNVMMRWPANPDFHRMLKDLQTLLRASQIG